MPPADESKDRDHMPQCAKCGGEMIVASVTPRLGGLPELRTFICNDCGEVVTYEIDNPNS
jgi:hypothetical protein